MGFHHTAREVWERTIRVGRTPVRVSVQVTCDKSGEDRACQDSLCGSPAGCTSVSDHLTYLDVPLGGTAAGGC